MTSAVRLLPAADADIDQAALYIARDSIEHALRFYDSEAMWRSDPRLHPHEHGVSPSG